MVQDRINLQVQDRMSINLTKEVIMEVIITKNLTIKKIMLEIMLSREWLLIRVVIICTNHTKIKRIKWNYSLISAINIEIIQVYNHKVKINSNTVIEMKIEIIRQICLEVRWELNLEILTYQLRLSNLHHLEEHNLTKIDIYKHQM